uniref:DNA polymerase n=1 Tax=Thermococcus sp. GT TaxID=370106 RepID=Q1WDM6_9EURY|nr:PolA precursor [Thermococcus sp. GT]
MILDTDYITEDGKPVIRIFKKENGEFKIEYDREFEPYIYALLKDDSAIEDVKKITAGRHGRVVKVKRAEKVKKKFLGRPIEVWKLYFTHPQDVPAIRDEIRKHPAVIDIYEYDIPFAKRYLIDRGLIPMEGDEELKMMSFDIETLYHEGEEFGTGPILMISYADEGEARVITWKKIDLPYVEVVSTEKEMIKRFLKVVKEKDPDVLITYNGDNFDFAYLKKRCEKLGIKFTLGRDGSEPKIQRMGDRFAVEVKGRIHFDLYPVIRRTINLPTYTLEAVYEAVFGTPKEKVYPEEITTAWETGEGLERVARYSMEDAKVTYELGREFFPMEAQLSRLIGQSLWDVSRSSTGNLVEWFLLRKAYERNEIAPNKPDERELARRRGGYAGGYVKEPERGLWDNIVYLDFMSLYPSIIITHNVSPDTLNREGCKEYDTAPQVGHKFCKDVQGFIPSLLGALLDERQKIKKRMKASIDPLEKKLLDYRQKAIKILANSLLPEEWIPLVENGKVRLHRIGEFVDKLMETDSELVKRNGDTEVLEVRGIRALSFDRKSKKARVMPVKAVIRHRYSGDVYEIVLGSGRRITVTEGHSLFAYGDGELREVTGGEIKAGDLLAVPRRVNLPEKKERLNLVELLRRLPEEETGDIILTIPVKGRKNFFKGMLRTLRWISGEEKRPRTARRYLEHLEGLGYVRLKKIGYEVTDREGLERYRKLYERLVEAVRYNGNKREYLVEFNAVRDVIALMPEEELRDWLVGTRNGFRMRPFVEIEEDFAKLLGYYVSEGNARKWRNQKNGWSYTVKLYNENQRVLDDMESLAERFFGRVKRGKNYIEIPRKMAYIIFENLCGTLAENKRVPEAIFTSPESVRWAFIEGYFIGDGDVHPSKRVRLSTKSELLVNGLVLLLNSLGVSAIKIRHDSGVYRVYVNEELPFTDYRKKKNAYYSHVIPKEILEETFGKVFQRNVSYEKFRELVKSEKLDGEKAKRIEWLLNGDVVLDKVLEVKKRPYEGYVYDLSVEEDENFLAGFGLLYAHNSYYGYYGYARARWYCKECAESVTAWGRDYIETTIHEIEERFGFKVLYADSVTGETEIIIKRNGKVEFVAIEELFQRVDYRIGEKEYCVLEGVEALTLDNRGRLVWKSVPYVMRHRTNKRIYRVWFTNSWYLDVTEDHSLIGYMNTSKVKPGKPLKERLVEVKPGELGESVKSLITPNRAIAHGIRVNPIAVKLWELIGLLVGDGNWGGQSNWAKYYVGLSLGLDKEEIEEKILKPLKNTGIISNYYDRSKKGDVSILSKWLARFMVRYFKDESGSKRIPEFMFNLPREYIEAFLRGLFSADGTVSLRKGVPEVRLTSVNPELSSSVRKLLWLVGVSNSMFVETNPNRYLGKESGTHSVHVRIKDKHRFAERIGFLLDRKATKLSENLGGHTSKKRAYKYDFDLVYPKKVEEIAYDGYVYDIEVEGTHRFFANGILVHNTDGFFATIPGADAETVKKKAKEFLKYINAKLPGLLELEYEGFYVRGFFVTKKKYAVIDEEGKITTRGLEIVRRDWSEIAKETQARVLEAILRHGDVEEAVRIVKDVTEKLSKYEVPPEKLVIHEQITRELKDYKATGPHVAIAKRLAARGIKIRPGTVISYIVLKGSGRIGDRAIPFDEFDPTKHRYDAEYYIENQVLPAVERILKAFGYKNEDLRYQKTRQVGLGAWLKPKGKK